MKIYYSSYNKTLNRTIRSKKAVIVKDKKATALATLEAALNELKNNPNCSSVNITITKEVK